MNREALKTRVREAVAQHAEGAIRIAQDIAAHAETGFREQRTAGLVAAWFREHGLAYRDGIALTGLRADVRGAAGPTIAVMGELDSLIVPGHPSAAPDTSAAHACGHHVQIGTMLAVAAALNEPDIRDQLGGAVACMALPAEEYIEIEYRQGLRSEGKIEFLGGKQEFIRLGEFDDVDMALLTHATGDTVRDRLITVGGTSNGHVAKQARFIGLSAHAGAAPHQGINALSAASIALMAINANRETFKDADAVRVHPIVTKGGDVVNAVPAEVRLEMYVRGRTLDAIKDANAKVDRALKAGALALGATVEITTTPGYLPLRTDPELMALYRQNAVTHIGDANVGETPSDSLNNSGSTDVGDVSWLMPTIQPFANGFEGQVHGDDFVTVDWGAAVTNPATVTAMTVVDLLANGAGEARRVGAAFGAGMTKADYLAYLRSLSSQETYQAQ